MRFCSIQFEHGKDLFEFLDDCGPFFNQIGLQVGSHIFRSNNHLQITATQQITHPSSVKKNLPAAHVVLIRQHNQTVEGPEILPAALLFD